MLLAATWLGLAHGVAGVGVVSRSPSGTPLTVGRLKAKIPGVTESLPGADVNGFVELPVVVVKMLVTQVDITWTYNDLLTFGPFATGIDAYLDVKVLNPDGTQFGSGTGAQTSLGLRLDLAALPLLEVRAIDLEDDPLAAGRSKIKITGVTESLPGADVNGFVDVPIDVPDVSAGIYTGANSPDGGVTYGPVADGIVVCPVL